MEVFLGLRAGVPPRPSPTDSSEPVGNLFVASILSSIVPLDGNKNTGTLAARLKGQPNPRVLVVDQGEELFTKFDDHWKDRFDFFQQVDAALQSDPNLRIIIALRQEYLADFERHSSDHGTWKRCRVAPLTVENARDTIIKPAEHIGISWDISLATELAEELARIRHVYRVPDKDPEKRYVAGEFVSPVHLQIVCEEIWRLLPEGIDTIGKMQIAGILRVDLDEIALTPFVNDSLSRFCNRALKSAAEHLAAAAGGNTAAEVEALLHVGCFQFVNSAGSRVLVPYNSEQKRVGRLKHDWAEALAAQQILQVVERSGEKWYELSHDRLADAIDKLRRTNLPSMLLAQRLRVLEDEVSAFNQAQEPFPTSTIEITDLESLTVRKLNDILYPDEIEYLLRTSLRSGRYLTFWFRFINESRRPEFVNIIREALASKSNTVIINTLYLLKTFNLQVLPDEFEWRDRVVSLLFDLDKDVADAAATFVAAVNEPDLYRLIIGAKPTEPINSAREGQITEDPTRTRKERLKALATVKLKNDWSNGPRESLNRQIKELRGIELVGFFALLLPQRFRVGMPYILLGTGVAALVSALFTAVARASLGAVSPTIMNSFEGSISGIVQGIFHGAAGGAIWGGTVAGCLLLQWLMLDGAPNRRTRLGTITAGTIGGLIGGLVLMIIVLGNYDREKSLQKVGWISHAFIKHQGQTTRDKQPPGIFACLVESWLRTRVGLYYPVTGIAIGACVAVAVLRQMKLPCWRNTADRSELLGSVRQCAIRDSRIFALVVAAAAILGIFATTDWPRDEYHPLSIFTIMCLDSVTLGVGGYGIYLGMVLALYVARVGVTFTPSQNVGMENMVSS
jgi:hypothetical protein